MFGAILKATNSSFQKGMTFCRSIYVKKVIELLAFIFKQPSYSKLFLFFFLLNQSIERFQIRQGILSSFEPDQGPHCLKRLY